MKCTNNRNFRRKRNRKKELRIRISVTMFFIAVIFGLGAVYLLFFKDEKLQIPAQFQTAVYQAAPFTEELCVTTSDVECDNFYTHDEFPGALLFDIEVLDSRIDAAFSEKRNKGKTTKGGKYKPFSDCKYIDQIMPF